MGVFRRAVTDAPTSQHSTNAEQARRFALELAGLSPAHFVDVMFRGIVLEPGETAYREHRLWLAHPVRGGWSPPLMTTVLLTDRRLMVTLPDRRVISLWWGSLIGFHVDLERGACLLDYGDGNARLLTGPDTPSVAVLGVALLYGVPALVTHVGLASIRDINPPERTC